jgi:hypothetical protein
MHVTQNQTNRPVPSENHVSTAHPSIHIGLPTSFKEQFSKVFCVGVDSPEDNTACYYRNVCYGKDGYTLYHPSVYKAHPNTSLSARPTKGFLYSVFRDTNAEEYPFLFEPKVSYSPLPVSRTTINHSSMMIWHNWAGDNIGHLLFEDFFGLYMASRIFANQIIRPKITILTKGFDILPIHKKFADGVLGCFNAQLGGNIDEYIESYRKDL